MLENINYFIYRLLYQMGKQKSRIAKPDMFDDNQYQPFLQFVFMGVHTYGIEVPVLHGLLHD